MTFLEEIENRHLNPVLHATIAGACASDRKPKPDNDYQHDDSHDTVHEYVYERANQNNSVKLYRNKKCDHGIYERNGYFEGIRSLLVQYLGFLSEQ
jgi:hypothetical protein